MRLEDAKSKLPLSSIIVGLTESEARELRDVLTQLLEDPSMGHEHVASADWATEVTVWIERIGTPRV